MKVAYIKTHSFQKEIANVDSLSVEAHGDSIEIKVTQKIHGDPVLTNKYNCSLQQFMYAYTEDTEKDANLNDYIITISARNFEKKIKNAKSMETCLGIRISNVLVYTFLEDGSLEEDQYYINKEYFLFSSIEYLPVTKTINDIVD